MKRVTIGITACLLFLACFTVHLTSEARVPLATNDSAAKPKVTVVFRGLMVLHPDPAGKYFEAGVVTAPEHRFHIEVRETSAYGVSSFSVPVQSTNNDVWTFEHPGSAQRGVSFYQRGAFDRKAGIGDERDFRWAVDVEGREFYNQQLTTKQDQLGLVMRVTSGEFYTKTRTRPLLRNKGNGTFEYFGRAADEIAADLLVEGGDVVLRSANSGNEILRLKDKPGTSYEIVVDNEFMTETHAANLGHFRYYYDLISKPRNEWYDFKVADNISSTNRHFNHRVSPRTDEVPCLPWGFGKRKTLFKVVWAMRGFRLFE